MTRASRAAVVTALAVLAVARGAAARQDQPQTPAGPAFSLSTSQATTTRDRAEVWLTFRQLASLDFRIYKVRDPLDFFAGLRDPHQFGTGEPLPVPLEPTLIERIASWKAAQRRRVRDFFRTQTTAEYRQARRATDDTTRVSKRVMLQVSTFAQVPLLNPDQLISSWRELLPNYRDAEVRHLPLDLPGPGVYVVEAVHDRQRAYTVAVVSDVGVVAKAAPGQMLLFAADRHTGEPRGACQARVISAGTSVATGITSADGVVDAVLPDDTPQGALGVVQCGDHVGVADPGSWVFGRGGRELTAFIYTDKPIYRPGHTAHVKAVLRWRHRDALAAFDAPEVEVVVTDSTETVVSRQRARVDEFGGVAIDVPLGAGAALGVYGVAVVSGAAQASGAFEVQEYRRARIRGDRHRRQPLRGARQRGRRRRAGALLLRAAGRQRHRPLRGRETARTSRRCAGPTTPIPKTAAAGTAATCDPKAIPRSAPTAAARSACRSNPTATAATTGPASRRGCRTPAATKSPAPASCMPRSARSWSRRASISTWRGPAPASP